MEDKMDSSQKWANTHKELCRMYDNRCYKKYQILWNKFLQDEINKRGNQCYRCNNSYPQECYEWHHQNRNEKEFTISKITRGNASYRNNIEKVKLELVKCDLVCANCHKIIEYLKRKL